MRLWIRGYRKSSGNGFSAPIDVSDFQEGKEKFLNQVGDEEDFEIREVTRR